MMTEHSQLNDSGYAQRTSKELLLEMLSNELKEDKLHAFNKLAPFMLEADQTVDSSDDEYEKKMNGQHDNSGDVDMSGQLHPSLAHPNPIFLPRHALIMMRGMT